jgi:exodeoxyribonuclease VII small subunit
MERHMSRSDMSFEQALKELGKTIEKLESPDLSLTNALDCFEKGIRLMKTCDSHLKSAEGRLKELVSGKDGEFIEKILGVAAGSVDGEPADD